jgi:hypothetical protein
LKKNKEFTLKQIFGIIKAVSKFRKVSPDRLTVSHFTGKYKVTDWDFRKLGGFSFVLQQYLESKTETHPYYNFTKEYIGDIVKKYNIERGRFFITAASPVTPLDYTTKQLKRAGDGINVVGRNLHKNALKAVENYTKRRDAELIILPMNAHVKALHSQPNHYDPLLKPYINNFATEYVFNRHLKAVEIKLNPQQTKPLTGLNNMRGRSDIYLDNKVSESKKTSLIVAHSKQDMKVFATGNNSFPRIIHSTGCITLPNYLNNRIGILAKEMHVMGGLVIEIDGDKFFIRQVQFNIKNGSFIDDGVRYHADGRATKERPEAFKMGDLHPGYDDPQVLDAWDDLFKRLQPKRVFYEDFFDAASITHHLDSKRIARAQLPKYFKSLAAEILKAKQVLERTRKYIPKDAEIVATYSNHPEMVMRYLQEGRYINDKVNFEIAHRMVVMILDGKNPVKEYLDPDNKMNWLGPNDDFFVEDVQMGAHGHLGVNGAKAVSSTTFSSSTMKAHSHTPGIEDDCYTVGHSTQKRHGYNNGPTTWIPCSGLVYKGGHKQLIMVINGQHCLDDE